MKKHFMLIALIFSFTLSSYALDKGVLINVPLSPAGSFQIETSKIKGKAKRSGAGFKASKIYIKTKDLKSGMDLRDDHMKNKDRLDAKAHPKIMVKNIVAKDGKGTGVIHIKGVKRKIKFKYSASKKILTAKFKLDVKKFPLKKLKYLGVGVKGIVEITAKVPIAK